MKSRQLASVGVAILIGVVLWFGYFRLQKAPPPSVPPGTSPSSAGTTATSSSNTPGVAATGSASTQPSTPRPRPTVVAPSGTPGGFPTETPLPAATPQGRGPVVLPSSVVASAQTAQGAEVQSAIEKINHMLRDYRTLMEENPVGTNSEIMKALMGANPKGVKLGPPEGMSLNGAGELVDPWGTPFFFHALSGTQMEIWSAGPDRKMGTADDIISK